MKKVKFEGKLNLNKETVTKLNDNSMNAIRGGALWTLWHCPSYNGAITVCVQTTCGAGGNSNLIEECTGGSAGI